MNILLTGAFGNVGRSTLAALLDMAKCDGDDTEGSIPLHVRCFDVPTRANRQAAARIAREAGYTKNHCTVETVWGDLRSPADVAHVAQGIDAAIHLGFVIPRLSVTGINSEDRPEFARSINVDGTRNLIAALKDWQAERGKPVKLVFASSLHVYGNTQGVPPPRTAAEVPHPIEHYAHHKVEAEGMVRASSLQWAVLRLAAALPLRLILDPGMFDVPLANRIEFIHTRDAGLAFARAALSEAVWGKTLLVGGGPRCQLLYREMMTQVLEAMGVGALPENAFSSTPFSTDWLDTAESQAILGYQQRTFSDYTKDMRSTLGGLRLLISLFQPLVRRYLLSRSPYYAH